MPELSAKTFEGIATLMHRSCGLLFAPSKKPLVSSRLSSRIQGLGLESFEEYLALIAGERDSDEFQVAVNLLTTNETYFFREPEHFELLASLLPGMDRRPVSIWSAASSFGDEAYSLAILLSDLQAAGSISDGWSILGTDISERVLRVASSGIYPVERLQHVSPERLRRYCLRGEGESAGLVQIKDRLRDRVRFGWLNLCRPIEPLGPFDVIFLRNVLIYFDNPTKTDVVARVLEQLRPGGLFFIGTAEGRVNGPLPLEPLRPGAFRKLPT
jgi:chemotaxis protein methyltransferase CheR